MKKFFTLIALFLVSLIYAQESECVYYTAMEKRMQEDPVYRQQVEEFERLTENASKIENHRKMGSCEIIRIPVVVHYEIKETWMPPGPEGAQSVIDELNKNYRKKSDYSKVQNYFKDRIADMEIEFELAKKDPNGKPTTGVTSFVEGTFEEDWNRNSTGAYYLQIYVKQNVSASFAYYYGNVTIRKYFTAGTTTHEIGHYLGLHHTWGKTNSPGNGAGINCNRDDDVDDTPNTDGNKWCTVGTNTCNDGPGDEPDNIENFMEYSGCRYMFTQGQKEKIRPALLLSKFNRPENYTLTGISPDPIYPCPVTSPPTVDFTVSKTNGCNGMKVNFTDKSTDTDANTTWKWTFQGGAPASSTQQNPAVTYSTPGTFDVKLVVTNKVGAAEKLVSGMITVKDCSPTAGFSVDYPNRCNGLKRTFTDLSITTGSVSWKWTFSGGTPSSSTEQSPTVIYDVPGNYDVKLTVTTPYGSDDTLVANMITTRDCSPEANFSYTPAKGCEGLPVQFSDSTISKNAVGLSWNWSFPGGTPLTSTEQNPKVVYNKAGSYNARLVVNDKFGTDTFSVNKAVTILDSALNVNTSVLEYEYCDAAGVVQADIATIASGGFPPYSYSWDDPKAQKTDTAKLLNSGIYTVQVTDKGNCKGTAQATIDEKFNIDIDVVNDCHQTTCTDGEVRVNVSDSLRSDYAYSWNDQANQTTRIASGLTPGVYAVTVTDSLGCIAIDTVKIGEKIMTAVTGQEEFTLNWKVYPNPSRGVFYISQEVAGSVHSDLLLKVYDMQGREVASRLISSGTGRVELNMAAYKKGIYLLELISREKIEYKKIKLAD